MLGENALDRVCVILVRARNPSNIGAVARAMHDFGFRHLRVVNEFAVPFEAARSAVDASTVLAAALSFATVAEAVADCTLVAGTTAVGDRILQHPLHAIDTGAVVLRSELSKPAGKVALLFGSEKTGLSNEELSHCHLLLTIPMYQHAATRHLSMNLGQAVAVCLYEVARSEASAGTDAAAPLAPAAAAERVASLLLETLETAEYTRHHPANSDLAQVRRLVGRMRLSESDTTVWLGILRQTLWKIRENQSLG